MGFWGTYPPPFIDSGMVIKVACLFLFAVVLHAECDATQLDLRSPQAGIGGAGGSPGLTD